MHTPEPWTYDRTTGRIGTTAGTIAIRQDATGWAGTGYAITASQQEANALLITAAPALLEALEHNLEAWEDEEPSVKAEHRKLIAKTRAAIALAKGTADASTQART